MRKMLVGIFVIFILGAGLEPCFGRPDQPRRYEAEEIKAENSEAGRAYFFRPVAFLFRPPNLWVLESDDSEIRVFGESGNFLYAFGRKGSGPGEFSMPSDMDVQAERVYVADGANRRVEILDKKGTYLGGFRVGFFPWRILALEEDRVIVAHLPSGRSGKEKTLHCFNRRGDLIWEARDSYFSGDSVFDALRNDIFLKRGERGEFYVIGRSEERLIFKFDRAGVEVGKIRVSNDYPLSKVAVLSREKGKKRELSAFCWSGDWHEGKFYLAIPDYTDQRDVNPGKQVAVVDEEGRVEAFIHFPLAILSLSVSSSGKKVFVLDEERELRIFEVKAR